MTVDRICIRTVDTARCDESVWTASERMHQRGVLIRRERIVTEGKDPRKRECEPRSEDLLESNLARRAAK